VANFDLLFWLSGKRMRNLRKMPPFFSVHRLL